MLMRIISIYNDLTAHPLEQWWLRAHGAFAFGSLWLLGVYIWLVLTGYLLYYAGGDAFRAAVSVGHWTAGLAALFFLLLHRRIRRSAGPRS
jgi:hypothetical protein